ncbi:MAG: LytTR family DNA-binding domain-containing protein [Cyclobacteriaceae bacterium]
MRVIIIEDELRSAERLRKMLIKLEADIEIDAILDSLVSAREWFRDNSPPDLAFLDIQLGDGTSFELLHELKSDFPVIFTTAFDQYAIKAFKYKSVDYLLKPVVEEELVQAIEKYQASGNLPSKPLVQDLVSTHRLITGDFKKRFLIKIGEQYKPVTIDEVAYFYSRDNQTYLMTLPGKHYPIDQSLEQIENSLNPLEFFRVSRKMLIGLNAIAEVHTYFNSRLLIKLQPSTDLECLVSRERVSDFKSWMDL